MHYFTPFCSIHSKSVHIENSKSERTLCTQMMFSFNRRNKVFMCNTIYLTVGLSIWWWLRFMLGKTTSNATIVETETDVEKM